MRREQQGASIPGSRYIRDYCTRCGEPIRVLELRDEGNHCKDCYNAHPPGAHTGMVPRQKAMLGKTTGG